MAESGVELPERFTYAIAPKGNHKYEIHYRLASVAIEGST